MTRHFQVIWHMLDPRNFGGNYHFEQLLRGRKSVITRCHTQLSIVTCRSHRWSHSFRIPHVEVAGLCWLLGSAHPGASGISQWREMYFHCLSSPLAVSTSRRRCMPTPQGAPTLSVPCGLPYSETHGSGSRNHVLGIPASYMPTRQLLEAEATLTPGR